MQEPRLKPPSSVCIKKLLTNEWMMTVYLEIEIEIENHKSEDKNKHYRRKTVQINDQLISKLTNARNSNRNVLFASIADSYFPHRSSMTKLLAY